MTVWPIPGYSAFYAIAVEKDPLKGFESVQEFTVSVPIKPRFLAIMKSTNYLLNALCAMESQEKGGRYGIQTDENGFITEGSVNNICFILNNKTLVTPTFEKILNGTTIERVFEFSKKLIENGDLARIEQRNIHIDEAKTSAEIFITSGDSIASVLYWDGQAIGTGLEGPLTKYFQQSLIQDFESPSLTIPINYSSYN